MLPNFTISPAGLTVGSRTFFVPFNARLFCELIGHEPRKLQMHPDTKDWPEVWIFDEFGIFLRCTPNTQEVSTVTFVFEAAEFAFSPKSLFTGTLKINDVLLHRGLHEAEFPLQGEMGFRKWFRGSFSAESGANKVSVRFGILRKARRGASAKPTLLDAEFSFSAMSLTEPILQGRLVKH